MIQGLYAAANGLLVESVRTDVIAGNLAGLSVPGYRRDVPVVSAFNWRLELTAGGSASVSPSTGSRLYPSTRVDLEPGPLRHTGGQFDLALEGDGYFCIATKAGEAYTRNGAFRLDASRRLVTGSGDPVLGQAGPIQITGNTVEIQESGDVLVDGIRTDRIKLAAISAGALVSKLGGGLLRAEGGSRQAPLPGPLGRVRQGYLEEANVNAVRELASMISALRAFEASQRALQANDQTLDKAINDIGRV